MIRPTDENQFTEYGGEFRWIYKTRDLSRYMAARKTFECDYVKLFKLEQSNVKDRFKKAQRVAESFFSELMDYVFLDMIENDNSFCLSDKHTRIEPYRIGKKGGIGFFMDIDGVDRATKQFRMMEKVHIPVVQIMFKKDYFRIQKLARSKKYVECIFKETDLEIMLKKDRIQKLRKNAGKL